MDSIKFKVTEIHPEEYPDVEELNNTVIDIQTDLINLDSAFIDITKKYKELIETSKLKINDIHNALLLEQERQQDINILCNKYSDFNSIITINNDNIETNDLTFEDNIISGKRISQELIAYKVDDILGNGYEGNKYVYSNEDFLNKSLDSSNRESISDNNLGTYYEYSRITNDTNNGLPKEFNTDSIEVQCTITISSDEYFNLLKINSDRKDLILVAVFTSEDGNNYRLDKEYNIAINDNKEKYNDQCYIYNSGLVAFKPCHYVKLILKSDGVTNDEIAYIKNNKRIVKLPYARRHCIKINDINVYRSKYTTGTLITKQLITEPIQYLSLAANEYIQEDYSDSVKYMIIVNGVEHEVVPINSHKNGKKIIRYPEQEQHLDNTIYLDETIKTVKVKIIIDSPNGYITPYLSDVKLLIGGKNV